VPFDGAVDAPPTIGNNILRAIASVTKARVTHAVYSHHHADHAGAMALYEGARVYGQSEVAGLLPHRLNCRMILNGGGLLPNAAPFPRAPSADWPRLPVGTVSLP
jgi:glyoxylase-like metal-dependent hydrolase (beta-lactamase superfamily II)